MASEVPEQACASNSILSEAPSVGEQKGRTVRVDEQPANPPARADVRLGHVRIEGEFQVVSGCPIYVTCLSINSGFQGSRPISLSLGELSSPIHDLCMVPSWVSQK